MSKLASLLAAVLVASQTPDTQVGRFGQVGRGLAEAEITQITGLAKTFGKSPRLILGSPSMVEGLATITVYLEPDIAGVEVQRGRCRFAK